MTSSIPGKKKGIDRQREIYPVLKTEKGEKDPNDPQDKEDYDLIERSYIYDNYNREILMVKDAAMVILYLSLFVVLFISLWINMEKCEFPFNIKLLSNISYSKNHWGTPVFAIFTVFMFTLLVYFIRAKILEKSGTAFMSGTEKILKKQGAIVDTKTV